jgi:FixJ family two-component response regulator
MTVPPPMIYVVDDDDSFRKAIMRLLSAAGYEVRGYATCGDFLLKQAGLEPGCLILDVRLPGPSGLELQEALSNQGHAFPRM